MKRDFVSSYHRQELGKALTSGSTTRALLPISSRHKRILDVGCGMGQSLIGLRLPEDVEAHGVDCDADAIEAGRHVVPSNVKLGQARGEHLPFEDAMFDLVFSQLSLFYMDLNAALREVARVLRPGGDCWFVVQSPSLVVSNMLQATRSRDLRQVGRYAYILANGTLFHYFGTQFVLFGRRETFQTASGMRRAMSRAGLETSSIEIWPEFVIRGRKPGSD